MVKDYPDKLKQLVRKALLDYDADAAMTVKSSHENPDVARLYREYLGTPGSRLAHDLLHTHYDDRRTPAKAPLFRQLVVKLHAAECE